MKPRQQHLEEHSLQRGVFKNNSNNHNNTNNNNGGGSLFNRLPWTTKLRSSLDSLFSLLDTPIIDVSSSNSPPDFKNLSRPHPSSLSDTNPIQKKKYQSLSTPASPPQSRYHMVSSHSRSSSSLSSNLYQHTESQESTDYQTEPNSAAVYSTSSSSSDYQLRQDNLTQELSSISQLLPELVNSLYIDPSPRFGNTIDGSAESPMRPPSPISLPTSPSTPSYSSAESPTHLAQLLADDNFDLTSSNFEAPNATLVDSSSYPPMGAAGWVCSSTGGRKRSVSRTKYSFQHFRSLHPKTVSPFQREEDESEDDAPMEPQMNDFSSDDDGDDDDGDGRDHHDDDVSSSDPTQSHYILERPLLLEKDVRYLGDRWVAFISALNRSDKYSQEQIRRAVRDEIPKELRGIYWKTVTGAKECSLKNPDLYRALMTQHSSYKAKIQKDVYRTLPHLVFFRKKHGAGQTALFNVLKAYSVLDAELGYCQSMSFIVAVLLLNMPEQDAFWVLCQLTKAYHIRGFFEKGLPLLRLALYQLDRLIEQELPQLFLHFKRQGVLPVLYASEWFSTLYVYTFPLDVVIRLWDVFFAEGSEYLFKVAVAVLTLAHDHLLALEFDDIITFLKQKQSYVHLSPETIIRVADSLWVIDGALLAKFEERYNSPKRSVFRLET